MNHPLHTQAVSYAKDYLRTEKALLTVLMEMDKKKVFYLFQCTGIFNYCMKFLGFSESQASYFASVARKSKEVPELKAAIDNGLLTISKARRITKVIDKTNQEEWITKAATLPQRELDREVAAVNPSVVQERVKPVDYSRFELKLGMSLALKKKLDRVLDLESRKQKKAVNLEQALEVVLDNYLKKHDPVEKAKRTFLRKEASRPCEKGQRRLPSAIKHHVNLRDEGKCTEPGCANTRFTEIHHIKPLSEGGSNALTNLKILCSQHHRMQHRGGLLR
jgi:5-methylcytosine-specific restriction endonuclease McrA